MENIFDAPPEGAIPTATERVIQVKYKSLKTPESLAPMITDSVISESILKASLGFSYWDKDKNEKVPLNEFTFVALEVYAGVTGYNEAKGTSYWSNRVIDSRTDEMIVFASGSSRPVLKGIYQDIKGRLETDCPGAKYTKFVRAYCLQLDQTIEIELSASAERGMQKAIATADNAQGRKTDWHKVFILGLAKNDHLWGFHLKGYAKETRQGDEYAGKGELYFSPVFYAGIVNPSKQADLHGRCVHLQAAERALHEVYKAKYSQQPEEREEPPAPASAPAQSFPTTAATPPKVHANNPFPDMEPAGADDDLPF